MNIEKYKKILLILTGILLIILISLLVFNIFKKPIKTPELASTTTYVPQLFPIIPTQNLQNIIKPTLSQGDCFYSGVYRSLKYKNLLNKLCNCQKDIICNSEDNFIKTLRNLMGINKKFIDDYLGLFYNIISMKSEPDFQNNFNLILNNLGDTRNVLLSFNNTNKFEPNDQNSKEFITEIQKIVGTRKSFAGELEVLFVKNLLKDCGITINIVILDGKTDEKILKEIKVKENEENKENSIILVLSGVHYQYV